MEIVAQNLLFGPDLAYDKLPVTKSRNIEADAGKFLSFLQREANSETQSFVVAGVLEIDDEHRVHVVTQGEFGLVFEDRSVDNPLLETIVLKAARFRLSPLQKRASNSMVFTVLVRSTFLGGRHYCLRNMHTDFDVNRVAEPLRDNRFSMLLDLTKEKSQVTVCMCNILQVSGWKIWPRSRMC